jgi:hypothetical protein
MINLLTIHVRKIMIQIKNMLSIHLFYENDTGLCSTSSEYALNTIVVRWSDTIF